MKQKIIKKVTGGAEARVGLTWRLSCSLTFITYLPAR